ncbi:putative protein FAM90A22P [Nannospalax galili]|uniref:putative protein FAM90A22P n=1 Tax=Nannospalax galili TaxID=1026970 RepID=UPI00111BEAB3|nr:putative protein FAM90A22P [Nannospalax galili]
MGPLRLSIPRPEDENPRLKCKNCGAFGHTARSSRCPIKCSSWIVVPQLLGPRKENQNPCKTQNLRNPGLLSQEKREKEPRNRPDQQSKHLLHMFSLGAQMKDQRNHVDVTRSPDGFTHPGVPMLIHRTRKIPAVDHAPTSLPLDKKYKRKHTYPEEPLIQSPDPTFSSPGHVKSKKEAITATQKPVSLYYVPKPSLENLRGQSLQGHSQSPNLASRMHGKGKVLSRHSPATCHDGNRHPVLHTHGQVPKLSFWVPGKKPSDVSLQSRQNPTKKVKVSSIQSPENSFVCPALKAALDLQTSERIKRPGLQESSKAQQQHPWAPGDSNRETWRKHPGDMATEELQSGASWIPTSETSADLGQDPTPVAAELTPGGGGGKLRLGWQRPHGAGAGLQNVGNSCYVNAALQCLTSSHPGGSCDF